MSASARATARVPRTRKAIVAAITAALAGSVVIAAPPASATSEAYKQFSLKWTQANGTESVSLTFTKGSTLEGHIFVTQMRKNDKGSSTRTASVSVSLPLSALTFDGKKVALNTGNKLGDAGKIDIVYTAGDNSTSTCGGNIVTSTVSKTKVDAFNVKGLGVAINKAPDKGKRVVYNGKIQQNPGKFCPGWVPGPGGNACGNESVGFVASKGMALGVHAQRERYYSKAAKAFKNRATVSASNFGTLPSMNNAGLYQSVSTTMPGTKVTDEGTTVSVATGAPFLTGSATASSEGTFGFSNWTACKQLGNDRSERSGSVFGEVTSSSLEIDFLIGNQKLTKGTEEQPQTANIVKHEVATVSD